MSSKNIREIKRLAEAAVNRDKSFVESCNQSNQRNNPQVIRQRLLAEGRIDALESVLNALAGDFVVLKISAGE